MHSSKKHTLIFDLLYLKIKNIQKCSDILPVGCFIVCSKTFNIISFSINNKKEIPFDHAEFLALKQLKRINYNIIENYYLYVSLEPCLACIEIIKKHRIRVVFYGCRSLDSGIHTKYQLYCLQNITIIPILVYEKKFQTLLKSFFLKKRN